MRQTINKQFVRRYFNDWIDYKKPTIRDFVDFLDMLQRKIRIARMDRVSVFCYDKNYSADEIEKMLIIAEDNREYVMKQIKKDSLKD